MNSRTLKVLSILFLLLVLCVGHAKAATIVLFESYVTYSVVTPHAAGVGDFNHDGLSDAAVANYTGVGLTGELKIFHQNIAGSLDSPVTYAAGSRTEALAVGDLNDDGWDDVVVVNVNSNTISVFLQQADGSLAARTTYITGTSPDAVAVGDVNGDGLEDVAVANWNSAFISIFTQTDSGTLSARVDYASPQAGYDDIAIGDVNGDGLNDIVKMNGQLYANPDLSVFTQSTTGTLNIAVSYSLPGNILGNGVDIGDVTGDGKLDVVMSYGGNTPSAFIAVFAQAGDGTLQAPVSYIAYDIPEALEVADINEDGLADVIVAHGGWNMLSVYLQQNDSSLGSYSLYALPINSASWYKPQALVIGDVNDDTQPDILVANYNFGLNVLYHVPVHTISGNAGVAGATLTYTGGSTTADGSGYYAFEVLPGWSGTVTPNKTGYTFSPANRSYTNLSENQTAQDYTAIGAPAVVHVKPDGLTTGGCGATWAEACELQTALTNAVSGDELWVAAGTYKPTTGSDRNATFQLKEGVAVYGGFAGMETARDQRDAAVNLTILSGDLIGDDAGFTNNTENVFHVVTGATGATLDGFTITAGNSNAISTFPNDRGGGMYNDSGSPILTNITFSSNAASWSGGGIFNYSGSPTLTNVTFSGNVVSSFGGGMYNGISSPILMNVTFSSNSAQYGGGMYNYSGNPMLTNVTFSGNSASVQGGGIMNISGSNLQIRNTVFWDNTATQISNATSFPVVISDSVVQGGYASGTNIILADPLLGALGNYGGDTQTIPLLPGSSAINLGNDSNCAATDQRGITRPQGAHCDIGAYEREVDLEVTLGSTHQGDYYLSSGQSTRVSYAEQNNGPLQITSLLPSIASERVLYAGVSYSEMLGFPVNRLTTDYVFPWYNNTAMDFQLRVSNLGGASTEIKVYLGNSTTPIDTYTLPAGQAIRKSYAGQNNGPLRVTSSVTNILTTLRVIYATSSYSELMGFPANQLTTEYVFPWYNNTAMDSQLRVSNFGSNSTEIKVYLGSSSTPLDTFTLAAGQAVRKSYTGQNNGPLRVTSSVTNILATLRVLYASTSYSELMGFPANQLAKEYWYPVYDNTSLDSQLRVSNLGSVSTEIKVYLGNSATPIDTYTLLAGQASRKSYTGQNTGPLHVTSSATNILTTTRLLYTTPGFVSYYELTGLSNSQLATEYLFPWYNNFAMRSEVRFAVP